MQYFKTTVNSQQQDAQALFDCCEGFCGTLEDTVSALVIAAQQGCSTQKMSEYIIALTSTVIDAQKFITTHYH